MNQSLLIVAAVTWIFWGCLFVAKQRIEQMYAAGFGSGNTSALKAGQFLLGGAFLNFLIFFFVYGFRESWLGALAVVAGGYAFCMLFIAVLRLLGLSGAPVNALAKVGLIGLPVGSIALWFVS